MQTVIYPQILNLENGENIINYYLTRTEPEVILAECKRYEFNEIKDNVFWKDLICGEDMESAKYVIISKIPYGERFLESSPILNVNSIVDYEYNYVTKILISILNEPTINETSIQKYPTFVKQTQVVNMGIIGDIWMNSECSGNHVFRTFTQFFKDFFADVIMLPYSLSEVPRYNNFIKTPLGKKIIENRINKVISEC